MNEAAPAEKPADPTYTQFMPSNFITVAFWELVQSLNAT